MGTPEFAVPCLDVLTKEHDVIAVFTQPDRPKGRGQKLAFSPVKEFALQRSLAIYQPQKIKTAEMESLFEKMHPDLIVVVAFGQILSKRILDSAALGCVNVHASLLPRYRGAAPIHWAIMNGEKKTGVTTMFMNEGLDTGDMILRREIEISPSMNTGELHDALMEMGAELLKETVRLLAEGSAPRESQDDNLSNYAPLLKKSVEKIDWNTSAVNIHNKIRGLNPWPGSYAIFKGKNLKLWQSSVVDEAGENDNFGEVIKITKSGFIVAAGRGSLEITELQPSGKRRMAAHDFICGNGISVGDKLE